MSKIDEIKERLKKSTPGPWFTKRPEPQVDEAGFNLSFTVAATSRTQKIYASPPGGIYPENDRQLIANAPTDIAHLLSLLGKCKPWLEALLCFDRNGIIVLKDEDKAELETLLREVEG